MTTPAPCWINLDGLVTQDLRAEMAAFTERVAAYGFTLEDELLALSLDERWHAEIDDPRKGVPQNIFERALDWTGYNEFYDVRLAAGLDPDSVRIGTPSE
jgi:hypothetical protein